MFEVNKEMFGSFVAEQRKAKGYTQRELAERLFVSDKAVSKWERGLSMPDISLLIPLAELLEVSVMELLEGKRLEHTETIETAQAELWVKKALAFSKPSLVEEPVMERLKRQKKNKAVFTCCALVTVWLWIIIVSLGIGLYGTPYEEGCLMVRLNLFLLEGMSAGFGCYFWLFLKEEQPVYYRKPNTDLFEEEVFRLNTSGESRQQEIWYNKSWTQLVEGLRSWSLVTMMGTPVLYLFLLRFQDNEFSAVVQDFVLAAFLAGIFLPVWRYQKKPCQLEQAEEAGWDAKRKGGEGAKKILWLGIAVVIGMLAARVVLYWESSGSGAGEYWQEEGYVDKSEELLNQIEKEGGPAHYVGYSNLNGTSEMKILPHTNGEEIPYWMELEKKRGSVSIEILTDSGEVIFFREDMEEGCYSFTISERVTVYVTGKEYDGCCDVYPEESP